VDQVRMNNPRREAAWLGAYALFYIGLAALTGLLIRHWPLPLLGAWKFNHDLWYLFFFKIGMLLVLPCIWFHRRGYRPGDLLPGWRLGLRSGLVVALAFAAGFCLNLGHLPRIETALQGMDATRRAAALILGVILPLFSAGLPEEIVYRGLLQTRLEAVTGRGPGLLITAALFTAWHLPTRYLLASGVEGQAGDLGSVLVGTGLPVFIVGMIFGLLWDRYRSLPPLIAAHWAIDVLPAVSSFVGAEF